MFVCTVAEGLTRKMSLYPLACKIVITSKLHVQLRKLKKPKKLKKLKIFAPFSSDFLDFSSVGKPAAAPEIQTCTFLLSSCIEQVL